MKGGKTPREGVGNIAIVTQTICGPRRKMKGGKTPRTLVCGYKIVFQAQEEGYPWDRKTLYIENLIVHKFDRSYKVHNSQLCLIFVHRGQYTPYSSTS